MTPHEPHGHGSLSLLLAFLGGALIGGAAVVLLAPGAGPELRRRLAGAADDSKDAAARVPQAIRRATIAAQEAFVASMKESQGEGLDPGEVARSSPGRSAAPRRGAAAQRGSPAVEPR